MSQRNLKKSPYKIRLEGIPASSGIGEGPPVIVENVMSSVNVNKYKERGFVLIVPYSNPMLTLLMLKASAIVTEIGGIVSHAAIVARELGIPCVVNVKNCTKELKKVNFLIVDGFNGVVYGYDKVLRQVSCNYV